MADNHADLNVIRQTQESLGKVVKKVPLNDKLLGRPPFKFLHDIIKEIITNSNFMVGLYTPDELNSANVTTKEAKILFLQKTIDVLGFVNGSALSIKAGKIVAGLEPNATNLLLQTLARSVLTRKESSLAVRKVLKNEKPPKNDTKGKTFVASSASGQRKSSVAKPIPRPSLASSRSNPVTTTKSKLNSTQVRDGSVRRSSNERLIKDPASGNHLRSESSRSLASSASRTTPKTAVNRDGGDDTLVSTKPSSSGGHRTRPSSRAGSAHRPPPPGLATTPDQSSTELANHSTQSLEITQKSPSPDAPELSLSDQIAIDKASAIQQLEESLNVQSSSSVQESNFIKATTPKSRNSTAKITKSGKKSGTAKRMRSNELVGDAHKMSNMSGIIHESSIISSSDKGRVVTARPSTARIGTARPTTARAAPPKLITQQQLQQQLDENETIDTPSVRTIEAIAINTGTGSGPLVSIIRDQPTDGAGSDDDDGNDGDAGNDETNEDERGKRAEAIDNGDLKMEKIFKTNRTTLNKETMDDDVDFGMGGDTLPVSTSNVDSDAEKGALVRQLVQSKRMLESVGPSSDPSRGSASSERAKSAVQQLDSGQLKRVMDGVQRLCRLANPTSKAIEYLQEELDMMLAERRTWIAEAQSNRAALTRLQSNCVQELKSLQDELSTLERQVQQQQSLRTQRIGSLWQAHRSMMQAAQQLVEQ